MDVEMKFLTLMFSVNFAVLLLISSKPCNNPTQNKQNEMNSDTISKVSKPEDVPKKYSPPVGSRLAPEEAKKLLQLHNQIRADVGVDEITWSGRLATYAQEWADHLGATSCDLEHRPNSGKWELKYGENLFMGSAKYYGVTSAVKAWEEEKKNYKGQAIDRYNQNKTGHYTQIVWKTTKQIGCAKSECRRRIIVVCNYDPPGNELGRKPY
jgi:pathogenesis-related protein 1